MTEVVHSCDVAIRREEDVVLARQTVRKLAVELDFSMIQQTKLVTAVSELARNTFDYGGGGVMTCEQIYHNQRTGLRICFEDQGPGIASIEQAMTDGWSSNQGLGLGLTGAKRLCDDFEIDSELGKGTRVQIVKWK